MPEIQTTWSRRSIRSSSEDGCQRCPREGALGDETASCRLVEPYAVRVGVAARHQDHQWWVVAGGDLLGDREAVGPGQLDVEQHDVGSQPGQEPQRVGAVSRLAD